MDRLARHARSSARSAVELAQHAQDLLAVARGLPLADAVGEGPYLLGGQFSAVDLYAAMLVSWDPDMIGMLARVI